MLPVRWKKPQFFVFAATLFALTFFSACKSKNPTTPSPNSDRILTIAHEGDLLTLDPQLYNDSIVWSVIGNIYEPLVAYDKDMAISGKLAERWENPNDLTWRFYLRKNVKFHDGKQLNADDVVYTINRGLLPERPGTNTYLISVKEVKKIDQFTVDIVTDRPHPVLLNMFTFVNIIPTARDPKLTIEEPVGTGPYRYARRINPNEIVLTAFEDYWAEKPKIKEVRFTSYPTHDETVASLLKGDVQLTRDFSEILIPKIEQANGCKLVSHDTLGISFLGFNLAPLKENPLSDLNVRRAIYHALDTGKMLKDILLGHANVATQLVAPNVFGFDPDYTAPKKDLTLAKKLLADAGYPKGFQTDVYGTEDIRIRKIADQLATVGIKVKPHRVPWKELYERALKHELPMFTLSWASSTGDASDFLNSCVHSSDPKSGYGNFNIAGYINPDVDRLIEQSGEILKINQRREYLQKAMAITMADYPYIPLFSRYRHYGVSNEISWQPRRDGRLYAADIAWR